MEKMKPFQQLLLKNLVDLTWQQIVSSICKWILMRLYYPMKLFGSVFEWTTNFVYHNGGLFGLLFKFVFIWRWGEIYWPNPNDDIYLSTIGALDPREELQADTSSSTFVFVLRKEVETDTRHTSDVCSMAAKLSYENPQVVKRVVEMKWRMHFVKFYNCWNETQKMNNTQAFICMDQAEDAKAVVVAFRGTEAFNMLDWSTDIDFAWAPLKGLGGVHLGFLEALGLATRNDLSTIARLAHIAHSVRNPRSRATDPNEKAMSLQVATSAWSTGLSEHVVNNVEKTLAFKVITAKVTELLNANPQAKLLVTGHSLGGALASLYAVMLFYMGSTEVASKLSGVYTFGQPRVGDEDFAAYATGKLEDRYFRVVYCNDMVPRVPLSNYLMRFQHFGRCCYMNSCYHGSLLREQPNPNFFGRFVTTRANAVWELLQGACLCPLQHGREYAESPSSLAFRALGLVLPGLAAHSPTNYVNSVRLAPLPLQLRLKGLADATQVELFTENVIGAFWSVVTTPMKLLGAITLSDANFAMGSQASYN